MAAHEAAMEETKGDDIFHPEDVYEFFKDVWAKTRQAEEEKLQEEAAWEPEKASETVVVEQEDAPESSKKPRTTANQKALKVTCELLRIFVSEAIHRAALMAEIEGVTTIDDSHLARIVSQLLHDF